MIKSFDKIINNYDVLSLLPITNKVGLKIRTRSLLTVNVLEVLGVLEFIVSAARKYR